MRDFDEKRAERHKEREEWMGDRGFILGGETFYHKANVSVDILRRMTSDTQLQGADYIDAVVDACLGMIEADDDAHNRFKALLERQDDPVTMTDLQDVYQGLVEEAFKRPTQASSPSGTSDAETGTTSTEDTSTAPAAASAA